ncbi:MAG TPA: DNA polymerase III subunit alpha [Candidatus Paceibacterota bacterium]|nr:DNA polymerase III subunit alpha [Candidatus Paceibacterota bacterium]
MSAQRFSHLHTHSHYSLLEALPKIPDLVAAAKADGQGALALTDNGNLYGAIEFYKEAKKQDVKPIIGVDFFVSPRTRFDKEHRVDDRHSRLVLLAKNETGYKNLITLVSKSHLEGFYYRPRIDRELMAAHADGLLAILPSFDGEHARAIKDEQDEKASEAIHWYKRTFNDLYAEITHHPEIDGHEKLQKGIAALAQAAGIPLVAAHDVYYLAADDALARELVIKIKNGGTLDRDFSEATDFSFISQDRATALFTDTPEALDNTQAIAEQCNLELELGKWVFPNFPIPDGKTPDDLLRELAYAGFEPRGLKRTQALTERLDYELSVIAKKGYAPYFLVVSDLLRYAHEHGILTNIRGSVAGSLVTYLAHITNVNPIEYNLPFERFLNPERPSAPDIDMDYADNRRDEVIAYAREKYGEQNVAQIGTFGTMLARAAVRDVARALGHSYGTGDAIAKMIPFGKQGFPVTIDSSLRDVPDLAKAYKSDPVAREILDMARKIEGNARHVGVHAAGVVIAPSAVTDFVPIQHDPKGGKIITQYDMHAVEDAGLLKFDFLGLTNLSTLADARDRVKQRLGVEVDFEKIPLDDKKTFDMLSRGETLGVFQLAGGGMTNYLVDLKPSVIHDINAMVALYRPGPMNFIPYYIERKHNPALVKYLDPRLEPILKNSYGVITYQDDVLQIAIQLAGYSWLEADKFRKAMGKKIPAEMAAQKEKFTKGAIEHGMKPAVAEQLWQQIETFAAYGFNKAHAASYGRLAYETAYMKANFPVDYMAAVLTSDAGDVEKIAEVVAECKRMNINILPPSVNESRGTFTVIDDQTIRFGMYSIKNFGTGIADAIIAERESGGPFATIEDFLSRIADKNLNKKSLEALIMSGSLDDLGERRQMLMHIEQLLEYRREHLKAPAGLVSLFGASTPQTAALSLPDEKPATLDEKLAWEKELLGFYVSGHPLDRCKDALARQKMNLKQMKESYPRGVETVIGGMLESTQFILTKNGERMMFGRLADYVGNVEVVVFPRILKENEKIFSAGNCMMLKGKFSDRNGEASFVAERVKAL